MRNVMTAVAVSFLIGGMLLLFSESASALPFPGDFLTGGGWIYTRGGNGLTHPVAKANFGVGGGTKNGNWWGHLNYIDHGNGLHVHGIEVTGYIRTPDTTDTTAPNGQPHGSREICGRATTNHPDFPEVHYKVRARDNSEPGVNDIFIIWLTEEVAPGTFVQVYNTEGVLEPDDDTLGGTGPGGGNINLHKHNPSNINPSTLHECNA